MSSATNLTQQEREALDELFSSLAYNKKAHFKASRYLSIFGSKQIASFANGIIKNTKNSLNLTKKGDFLNFFKKRRKI